MDHPESYRGGSAAESVVQTAPFPYIEPPHMLSGWSLNTGGESVDRALIVVAKEPEAGKTKTRLSPPLSGTQAAELYRRFLLDTLELMLRVEIAQPLLAYTPDEAEPFFRRFAPSGFELVPQVGADLGERLDHVLAQCLREGYRQAVVMDSDSPTLPVDTLRQAFRELDDPGVDVVLGPCEDGGYYLIGVKAPCPALFQGIAWSTPTVVAETLDRTRDQGLQVTCLPCWYDIDTYADLQRLAEELHSLPEDLARHTRALLANRLISRSSL
jgi:rSAM/selenodomain-associated transferase 1